MLGQLTDPFAFSLTQSMPTFGVNSASSTTVKQSKMEISNGCVHKNIHGLCENICLSWLPLILLCGCLVGCGKGNVETDPKALADEAAKIDKQVAEGEKGL